MKIFVLSEIEGSYHLRTLSEDMLSYPVAEQFNDYCKEHVDELFNENEFKLLPKPSTIERTTYENGVQYGEGKVTVFETINEAYFLNI